MTSTRSTGISTVSPLASTKRATEPPRRAKARSITASSQAATEPALDPDGHVQYVQYVQARYLESIGSDKYDNPAGILGSQAPDDRVADVLARHAASTGRLLVAIVDADSAGRAWGERLAGLLQHRDRSLDVVEPPEGLDLNGLAIRNSHWTKSIGHGLHQPLAQAEARFPNLAT